MHKNTKTDKVFYCDKAIETANKLIKAIEEIKEGQLESTTCKKYGINKTYLRKFVFNSHISSALKENNKEEADMELLASGAEKLYCKLTGQKKVPYEAQEIVEYCLKNSNLDKKQVRILRMMYNEDLTLEQTGSYLGLSRERIRQIEEHAILKMRKYNKDILKSGTGAFFKVRNQKLETYLDTKERELQKYQELLAKTKQVENDIATIKEELNVKEKNVPEVMTIGEMLDMHRKDGTISTRLFNCFNRIYAKTKWKSTTYIFDLNGYSKKRLLSDVRNLGIKTLEEMEELLKQHNVFLSE